MSSLFQTIFGCCLVRRALSTQPDERTPLVPPPAIDIIDQSPVIEQDSDELSDQLFAAHRDAASRMVNVEAAHPFIVLPNHDSSYSRSDSRSQSRSSSQHFDPESRSASPEGRRASDQGVDGDVFHVGIAGVRFLRPDVMRGRSGSVNRGRPRLDLRNGSARGSKENMIPVPGEGLSSYDTQIPTPTQPIQNPMDTQLSLQGKSVVREFPPVHEVMGVSKQDFYD